MPRALALLLTPLSLLLNVLLWWRRAQRHKIYGGSVGRSIEIHSADHSLHGGGWARLEQASRVRAYFSAGLRVCA